MSTGSLLVGIAGEELDAATRRQLRHPAVGGVVLFSRNFSSRQQITELVGEIKEERQPALLVCIDQEGGRVQRLRDGFTSLPALGLLGRIYKHDPARAADLAYRHARVMATEMLSCGIDLSFAPVLDLDRGSSVIGDRSFSREPRIVSELGRYYLAGMHDAGMKTTGKHFPGHGSVQADSHTHDVLDARELAELEAEDIAPFAELAGELDAVMIAHVAYPSVDPLPAGYSRWWLAGYLRERMRYRGVILSDDLGMHAAKVAGNLADRCRLCLAAGCDLLLVCQPSEVAEVLDQWDSPVADASEAIASLYGKPGLSWDELDAAAGMGAGEWRQWQQSVAELSEQDSFSGV